MYNPGKNVCSISTAFSDVIEAMLANRDVREFADQLVLE